MIQGYKILNKNYQGYGGFQYKIGKTYEMDESPICGERGFHFCIHIENCVFYYDPEPDNKIVKITALGDIDTLGDQSCTNKIKINEEISYNDFLKLSNHGTENNGAFNFGNNNFGNHNFGFTNIGDWNKGSSNQGNGNEGCVNQGNHNAGSGNMGDSNEGSYNWGSYNYGNSNSGNNNYGFLNQGCFNKGSHNHGDYNLGSHNVGNYNLGNNNLGSCCIGCFNTMPQKIYLFDKESDLTYEEWLNSKYYITLNLLQQKKWKDLNQEQKNIILSIPNFDAEKFKQIMSIDVNEEVE